MIFPLPNVSLSTGFYLSLKSESGEVVCFACIFIHWGSFKLPGIVYFFNWMNVDIPTNSLIYLYDIIQMHKCILSVWYYNMLSYTFGVEGSLLGNSYRWFQFVLNLEPDDACGCLNLGCLGWFSLPSLGLSFLSKSVCPLCPEDCVNQMRWSRWKHFGYLSKIQI